MRLTSLLFAVLCPALLATCGTSSGGRGNSGGQGSTGDMTYGPYIPSQQPKPNWKDRLWGKSSGTTYGRQPSSTYSGPKAYAPYTYKPFTPKPYTGSSVPSSR